MASIKLKNVNIQNLGASNLEDVRPRSSEGVDATSVVKVSENSETAQLQSLRLSSLVKTEKVRFFLHYLLSLVPYLTSF